MVKAFWLVALRILFQLLGSLFVHQRLLLVMCRFHLSSPITTFIMMVLSLSPLLISPLLISPLLISPLLISPLLISDTSCSSDPPYFVVTTYLPAILCSCPSPSSSPSLPSLFLHSSPSLYVPPCPSPFLPSLPIPPSIHDPNVLTISSSLQDIWYLEDLNAAVELDLSETEFRPGLICDNTFVLCEGSYDNNIFHVTGISLPPPEETTLSRSAIRTVRCLYSYWYDCYYNDWL